MSYEKRSGLSSGVEIGPRTRRFLDSINYVHNTPDAEARLEALLADVRREAIEACAAECEAVAKEARDLAMRATCQDDIEYAEAGAADCAKRVRALPFTREDQEKKS